jgi:hypothetical protein
MWWVRPGYKRREWGPFYVNFKWFVFPTSWGVHAWRESYNVTRRRSWFLLPWGLGDLVSGRRKRRRR